MQVKKISASAQLMLIGVASSSAIAWALPGWAQLDSEQPAIAQVAEPLLPTTFTPTISTTRQHHFSRPATTVKEWRAQVEAATVQVTGVSLNRTDTGLEILLQTAEGKPLQVDATKFRRESNSLIADIPNAVLALPDSQEFIADNPVADVATVQIIQQDANTIRVSVTGNNALPKSEVTLKAGELAYSLNPEANEADEETEITVTAEKEQEGYRLPNASTATKTDTPLRDIPQSIQVIPRQVIEDQQVIQIQDALRNVSGVQQTNTFGGSRDSYIIRGFDQFRGAFLRNGFREGGLSSPPVETANLERIEVLKGPASVLYGILEPGGITNLITEQPLSEPYYALEGQVGSFGLVRPSLDFSEPLTRDRTLRYRLNAVYQNGGYFRDFNQEIERYFIAPVISWDISDRANLTVEASYTNDERPFDRGLVALGDKVADIPFDRVLGELDDRFTQDELNLEYRFEYQISDDWTFRNGFRFTKQDSRFTAAEPEGGLDEDTGILSRWWSDNRSDSERYNLQANVIGKVKTGSVEHTLLFGIDFLHLNEDFDNYFDFTNAPPINIFNPVYGVATIPSTENLPDQFFFDNRITNLGLFLQDQITLLDNLKLLVGGRFDFVDQSNRFRSSFGDDSITEQSNSAFTPRIGIVYQPIDPLSLYASFSQSFVPNSGITVDGDLLPPERGTQYEVGIRGELFDGQLTANLAAFHITKGNVSATDLNNPNFSVAIGEVISQGIELDILGEISPGWNIIASYAHTDAEITRDNSPDEGNQLAGVPRNSGSLWTTYQIQSGDLRGLGAGIGLFFASQREGDRSNSFTVPGYLRTDASLFYRRDNWNVALNFRNLFNVDYIESADSRIRISPGTPFTVVGSISITF
ncbi:MAG: TonB-dependent receptor [Acaryochloridaceae cyanobacterium CSU_3_4]|nr:TonB-dependent receptor [Acaryochloridaceae cyanobacterium CSU_3_4]